MFTTAASIYLILGAIVVIPMTDDLSLIELLVIMTTWPIAVAYSISMYIKNRR